MLKFGPVVGNSVRIDQNKAPFNGDLELLYLGKSIMAVQDQVAKVSIPLLSTIVGKQVLCRFI